MRAASQSDFNFSPISSSYAEYLSAMCGNSPHCWSALKINSTASVLVPVLLCGQVNRTIVAIASLVKLNTNAPSLRMRGRAPWLIILIQPYVTHEWAPPSFAQCSCQTQHKEIVHLSHKEHE